MSTLRILTGITDIAIICEPSTPDVYSRVKSEKPLQNYRMYENVTVVSKDEKTITFQEESGNKHRLSLSGLSNLEELEKVKVGSTFKSIEFTY